MSAITDPIADMLTRLRNANAARHANVEIPASKTKVEIAKILHEEGFIRGFQLVNRGKTLRIRLKYSSDRQPVLNGLKRISKPGRRVYVGRAKLPRVLGGLGIAILSTSSGVMTARKARQMGDNNQGIGGEVLCYIW
jgi:small subunit ribosomal protein S8